MSALCEEISGTVVAISSVAEAIARKLAVDCSPAGGDVFGRYARLAAPWLQEAALLDSCLPLPSKTEADSEPELADIGA